MSSAISKASYSFHLDRITCFVEDETTWNSINLVAFETLPRLAEVEAVRTVMETIQTKPASKDFWISCVFPDDDELPDGSTISQVVVAMLSE
jgi:homocysteine S-methyltransferase